MPPPCPQVNFFAAIILMLIKLVMQGVMWWAYVHCDITIKFLIQLLLLLKGIPLNHRWLWIPLSLLLIYLFVSVNGIVKFVIEFATAFVTLRQLIFAEIVIIFVCVVRGPR